MVRQDLLIKIEKPEWLDSGLKHAGNCFRLFLDGRIPESIRGWMLVTACKRVLRAIYGSDLAAAEALRQQAIEKGLRLQTIQDDLKMSPASK